MKHYSAKKLALAGMFCAVAVVGSVFSFPVFGSKCAPVQHMVNILCAVLLGPYYGVGVAFVASLLRNLLGTGSIDPHAASLSGQRQLSAALRARDAVAGALDAAAGGFGLDAVSVCVDDALDALCDLTGENASEAVIEQVFERFCVGK